MNVTYISAVQYLRKLRLPDANQVVRALECLRFDIQMARVLREYAPERFQAFASFSALLEDGGESGVTRLNLAALEVVGDLIPLSWNMDLYLMEWEGGPFPLEIEPQGNPWYTWDDVDDSLSSVDALNDDYCLLIYFVCLSNLYVKTWTEATRRFEWPEMTPAWFDPKVDVKKFDEDRFFELLEASGLGCFKIAYQVAWRETGNIFYDFNPIEDGGAYELTHAEWRNLAFTLENVRWLVAEYAKCPPICEQYRQAIESATKDPAILQQVLDLYTQCLTLERSEDRPRKLIDIFAPPPAEETIHVDDMAPEMLQVCRVRGY